MIFIVFWTKNNNIGEALSIFLFSLFGEGYDIRNDDIIFEFELGHCFFLLGTGSDKIFEYSLKVKILETKSKTIKTINKSERL